MSVASDKLKVFLLKQKEKGIAMGKSAEIIGCAPSHLSEIASGIKTPSLYLAWKIANYAKGIKLKDWYEEK